jgi:transcriptional regulator with XRE-family HTH domain
MHKSPGATFNVALMRDDMTVLGLNIVGLARRARLSHMTVSRFLSGERQTAKSAKKLAKALGHDVAHYFVPSADVPVSEEAVAS